jgi:hypothetical protein
VCATLISSLELPVTCHGIRECICNAATDALLVPSIRESSPLRLQLHRNHCRLSVAFRRYFCQCPEGQRQVTCTHSCRSHASTCACLNTAVDWLCTSRGICRPSAPLPCFCRTHAFGMNRIWHCGVAFRTCQGSFWHTSSEVLLSI